MNTEIITIDPDMIPKILQDDDALTSVVERIKAEALSQVADVNTKKGRDALVSLAYKIRRTKAPVEEKGKELKAEAQKLINDVNKRIRLFKTDMDKLQAEVRKPVDEWQEKENKRIAAIEVKISAIADVQAARSSDAVIAQIDEIMARKITADEFEEFVDKAEKARIETVRRLKEAVEIIKEKEEEARRREEERAELERLRKEREEVERMKRELEAEKERIRKEREAAMIADSAPDASEKNAVERDEADSEVDTHDEAETPVSDDPVVTDTAFGASVIQDTLDDTRRAAITAAFVGVGVPPAYAEIAAMAVLEGKIPGVRLV